MTTTPVREAPASQHRARSYKGSCKIAEYEILGKLGEGTFGEVSKARNRRTGRVVALKKILMHNEKDGFPITALREIKLLKLLHHPNILRLEEMSIEHAQIKKADKRKKAIMYMVTPYMDHDLSGLLDNPAVVFREEYIKCYMMQLLEGTAYLHSQRILHRDMKAANLLINNKGVLQIADFGLARHYDGDVPRPGHGAGETRREYTALVVTRWYRPPELLLSNKRYTSAIDIWGVGCVFGEMLHGKPILAGTSDLNQLELIFDLMGDPTDQNMPNWRALPGSELVQPKANPRPSTLSQRFKNEGPGAISLLNELLKLNAIKRTNAIDALKHPYFRDAPLPAQPGSIPVFEESHELDRRKYQKDKRAILPPAPKGGSLALAMGPEQGWNGNGCGGVNNDRDGYGGVNSGQHNDRRPGNYHRDGPPPPPPPQQDQRRAAWVRDRGVEKTAPDTRLPPRPPPSDVGYGTRGTDGRDDYRDAYRDRDRGRNRDVGRRDRDDVDFDRGRDRSREGTSSQNGGTRGDVYIPKYDNGDHNRRDGAPRNRDRDDRRIYRDDRDDRRHNHDRGRDRLDYDDRSSGHGRTRSRTRSPVRDRGHERPRERDAVDAGYRR